MLGHRLHMNFPPFKGPASIWSSRAGDASGTPPLLDPWTWLLRLGAHSAPTSLDVTNFVIITPITADERLPARRGVVVAAATCCRD